MLRYLLGIASGVAILALMVMAPTSRPVYACTGGPGPFEEWAVHADAVVIAKAVDVGGPENTAPTAKPSPVPSATPEPAPSGDARAISLAGIGAQLNVVLSVAGSPPASIDIDSAQRQRIEEDLRRLEANPNLILSCPLDFLVQRYDEGQTYFLVLGFEEGQGWYTFVQWEIAGSDVVTGGADYVDGRLALAVPRPILDAYFPGLPANTGEAPEGVEALWVIQQQARAHRDAGRGRPGRSLRRGFDCGIRTTRKPAVRRRHLHAAGHRRRQPALRLRPRRLSPYTSK